MDNAARTVASAALPALVQPPPGVTSYFGLIGMLLDLVRPPPKIILDIRHRLFGTDEGLYEGRNVFCMLSSHRYQFFEVTGETPESFLNLLGTLTIVSFRPHTLSVRNRVLLVMLWLRSYPTFAMLSSLFNISITSVREEIRTLLPVFYLKLRRYVAWPSRNEWLNMRNVWNKIPTAVGAIDGTSHEIYRPNNEPQEQFYSGHRKIHAIHTQVIVDVYGVIRYIESGFLGHLNDAQQFRFMRRVGVELPLPHDCVLLADKIYPNEQPVMTPYTVAQLRRKHGRQRRKCIKFNRYIASYRVCVEHAIAELKTYKSIGTVRRNQRQALPRVVHICAGLVCRKKSIGLTV